MHMKRNVILWGTAAVTEYLWYRHVSSKILNLIIIEMEWKIEINKQGIVLGLIQTHVSGFSYKTNFWKQWMFPRVLGSNSFNPQTDSPEKLWRMWGYQKTIHADHPINGAPVQNFNLMTDLVKKISRSCTKNHRCSLIFGPIPLIVLADES